MEKFGIFFVLISMRINNCPFKRVSFEMTIKGSVDFPFKLRIKLK